MDASAAVNPRDQLNPAHDARFQAFVPKLKLIEGSAFTNDPADPGGPTRWGMSLRYLTGELRTRPELLDLFDLDHDGDIDIADIRAIAWPAAEAEYWTRFWRATGFDRLPQPLDLALLDEGINASPRAAVRMLQMALNKLWPAELVTDGALGPATALRISQVCERFGADLVLTNFRNEVADRYRVLIKKHPAFEKYRKGWLRRAAELGDV